MPFQKGQSGNPGGRPSPVRQELDALMSKVWTAQRRKRALERLATMAETGDEQIALDAIKLLLAYAYGKPKEQMETTGDMIIRVRYDSD